VKSLSMDRLLWNHWFWITNFLVTTTLLRSADAESLRVELLSGQARAAENDPEPKANDAGYMVMHQHSGPNRDIGGKQLARGVLSVMDKLARVNTGLVEQTHSPTTRRLSDPGQKPTRAGKSLSQRPVTIQVKPQDISIIFRRTGPLTDSNVRKKAMSQEALSRIIKLDIFDSQDLEMGSEPKQTDTEPEVSDGKARDISEESRKVVSSDDNIAGERERNYFNSEKSLKTENDLKHIIGKSRKPSVSQSYEQESLVRKPEGRSLDINSTEYKYYVKSEDLLINRENKTDANLAKNSILVDHPHHSESPKLGQLSSYQSNQSSMKKTILRISQSNLIGIGFGALLFILTVAVLVGLVIQKKKYLKKADSMEDNFVDLFSPSEGPTRFGQASSIGGWPVVHDFKSSSQEDLNSLDNDSFLNSLEAITTCEYWPERSWTS